MSNKIIFVCDVSNLCIQLHDFTIYRYHLKFILTLSLFYDRESWEELQDLSKGRKEKLRKSEECHKFYKDLTDALRNIKVSSPTVF